MVLLHKYYFGYPGIAFLMASASKDALLNMHYIYIYIYIYNYDLTK